MPKEKTYWTRGDSKTLNNVARRLKLISDGTVFSDTYRIAAMAAQAEKLNQLICFLASRLG
jgi:hypothetical protein